MRPELDPTSSLAVKPTTTGANIAHRGASAELPENTIVAIRRAAELGADLVEIDVQRTRDGALVLMHDTTLARTTNASRVYRRRAPWRVADFTWAELCRLDAGSWKGKGHQGEPIPSLQETLHVVAGLGIGLQLELKAPHLYPGVVAELAGELCTPRATPAYVVVQSFQFAAMKELKARLPAMRVGLLGRPASEHLPVLATWADQVNPPHRLVDKRYVSAIHDSGMQCHVWTVDGRRAMQRALRLGVDGVITNRPERLASALAGGARPTTSRHASAARG